MILWTFFSRLFSISVSIQFFGSLYLFRTRRPGGLGYSQNTFASNRQTFEAPVSARRESPHSFTLVRAHRAHLAHTSRIRWCSMHRASRCSGVRVEARGKVEREKERKSAYMYDDEGTKESERGGLKWGHPLRRRALLPTASSLSAYK